MFAEMTTKEIYEQAYWMLRCWEFAPDEKSKLWWGKELNEYRKKYETIFMKANESFWSIR